MLWLRQLFNKQPPKVPEHPGGPVMTPKGPKSYFEYFVDENDPKHITWKCRVYLQERQADGSFKPRALETTGPAESVTHARSAAAAWGIKKLKEHTT